MVFRRMRRTVRRAKKRTWYGKRYMSKGGVGRLTRDVRKIQGMLNVEMKHRDETYGNTAIPANGTNWQIGLLNGTVTGDGTEARDGSMVRFKSLQLRIGLAKTVAATRNEVRTRMIIFIDKEPRISGIGTAPSMTDLFKTAEVRSLKSWDAIQEKRFRILYDKVHSVNTEDPEKFISIYKRLNMKTTWPRTATTGTGPSNNALYIAFICDDTTAGAQFYMSTRMTYVDN